MLTNWMNCTQFLADCCTTLAARGKRVVLLVWDNASWHISKQVKGWIWEHNRQVKQKGDGVRILACQLSVKAPWLNPIEQSPTSHISFSSTGTRAEAGRPGLARAAV
jgi:hypothetical protein